MVSKENRKALPSCTTEGVNYIVECKTCRKKGISTQYLDESSRSAYQNGIEHIKEIRE